MPSYEFLGIVLSLSLNTISCDNMVGSLPIHPIKFIHTIMRYLPIYCALILVLICSCEQEVQPEVDYTDIPAAFKVEISTAAGQSTNQSFLPLIGNLGYLDESKNTAVLVLSESVSAGRVMDVRPIGTLLVREANQLKHIIIASPLDTVLQLSQTTSFQEFITKNAGEKQIIQDWFLYRNGLGTTELVGWKDEEYALNLLEKKVKN